MEPNSARSAAVVDGLLRYTSVSAISRFDATQLGGCERKWWFRYVKRIAEPDRKQHIDGKALHVEIQHYLQTGQDCLGPLARAGKHLLPNPGDDLLIEADISAGLEADGIPIVGQLDCAHQRGWYVDGEGELRPDPPNTIEVLDWKSTADLRYAKSGSELSGLVQMIGYAEWARRRFPQLEHARLSQVYFQKRGARRAKKSTALFPLATVKNRWHAVETTVKRMREVARAKSPEDVTANYASCTAYGGCAYKSLCPMSAQQKLLTIFGGARTMNLLDRLKQQTQPPSAPAPSHTSSATVEAERPASLSQLLGLARASTAAAQATIAPAGAPPTPEALIKDLEDAEKQMQSPPIECACGDSVLAPYYNAHKANCQAAKAIDAFGGPKASDFYGECSACGALVGSHNGSRTASGKIVHTAGCKAASPVVPPDAPTSEGPASAEPISPGTALAPAIAQAAAELGALPAQSSAPASAPASAEQAPKKRGRPKKAEASASAPASSTSPSNAVESAPTVAPSPSPEPETSQVFFEDGKPALALFVDVRVEGLMVRSLDAYIQRLCAALAEEYKAADIRCAPKDSPLAYGGWKGALAALAASEPPPPGMWGVADVRESELRQVVVEALKPLCAVFVRGL